MTFNYKEIFRIINLSFNKAIKWKIWKWLLTGGIGSALGTLSFSEKFFNLNIYRSTKYSLIFLASLFFLRFILIFIKESIKYFHEVNKNSIYGDVIILLKESFSEAHLYRKSNDNKEKVFMKSMMVFCDNLKIIYDKTTGTDCSVSIKVPVKDLKVGEGTTLKNLTRDKKHEQRDTRKYNSINHNIIGNSAFNNCLNKVITNQKAKYYINNNVNDIDNENYLNTSKACYENGVLPYNSELVHPITPLKTFNNKNYDCHGFICIDSNSINAFDDKYDPAIIEGVADGIYDIIKEQNNNRNGSD